MYFEYHGAGQAWDGGHVTHGAVAAATEWFLAEGYTAPNFDCYVREVYADGRIRLDAMSFG